MRAIYSVNMPYVEQCPNLYASRHLKDVIDNIEQITQAPRSLIVVSTLAVASTALQGHIDVEIPYGKVVPISIYALGIAGSGERKSAIEALASKGVEDFKKAEVKRLKQELVLHKIKLKEHGRKQRRLEKQLGRCSTDVGVLENLLAHELSRPELPRPRLIALGNSTPEASQFEMRGVGANACILSAEGGKVANSCFTRISTFLNDVWSGQSTRVDRKTSESFDVEDARTTILLLLQPSVLGRLLQNKKDDIRDNGFLSRWLVTYPTSNCGSRRSTGTPVPDDGVMAFAKRNYDLLSLLPINMEDYEKKVIKLSFNARRIWIDVSNDIEKKMGPGGEYEAIQDFASKLPENIVRVAAILHSFDELSQEDISAETLMEAVSIMAFFTTEFMRLFAAPPKYIIDAQNLMNWFAGIANSGVRYIKRNSILQCGPSGTRNKKDLDTVLDYLQYEPNFSQIVVNRTKVIDLHPLLPNTEEQLQADLGIEVSSNFTNLANGPLV